MQTCRISNNIQCRIFSSSHEATDHAAAEPPWSQSHHFPRRWDSPSARRLGRGSQSCLLWRILWRPCWKGSGAGTISAGRLRLSGSTPRANGLPYPCPAAAGAWPGPARPRGPQHSRACPGPRPLICSGLETRQRFPGFVHFYICLHRGVSSFLNGLRGCRYSN